MKIKILGIIAIIIAIFYSVKVEAYESDFESTSNERISVNLKIYLEKYEIEKSNIIYYYEPGENIPYGLYDNKDNLITEVASDESGNINYIGDIKPGKYYFRLLEKIDNYINDKTKYYFEFSDYGESIDPIEIKLSLTKLRLQVNITSSTSGLGLPGISVKIFSNELIFIDKITSDSTGIAEITLPKGKYYLERPIYASNYSEATKMVFIDLSKSNVNFNLSVIESLISNESKNTEEENTNTSSDSKEEEEKEQESEEEEEDDENQESNEEVDRNQDEDNKEDLLDQESTNDIDENQDTESEKTENSNDNDSSSSNEKNSSEPQNDESEEEDKKEPEEEIVEEDESNAELEKEEEKSENTDSHDNELITDENKEPEEDENVEASDNNQAIEEDEYLDLEIEKEENQEELNKCDDCNPSCNCEINTDSQNKTNLNKESISKNKLEDESSFSIKATSLSNVPSTENINNSVEVNTNNKTFFSFIIYIITACGLLLLKTII